MAEQTARALMREGFSDDVIARRTGLSLMALLELRATAAVEERQRANRGSGVDPVD